jgi:hypothetical protein
MVIVTLAWPLELDPRAGTTLIGLFKLGLV